MIHFALYFQCFDQLSRLTHGWRIIPIDDVQQVRPLRAAGPPMYLIMSVIFPYVFYQHFTKVSRLVFPTSLIQNFSQNPKKSQHPKAGILSIR